MPRICLLNMPFADLSMPSIALTQLRSVTESSLPDHTVEVIDVNHDFAQYVGVGLYGEISNSLQALYAGYGEWYFRQAAFPEESDNADTYVRRYLWGKDKLTVQMRELVLQKRADLDRWLDDLVDQYGLGDTTLAGFTSMFMQNVPSIALARKIKQINPSTVTIMGGANCEYPMGSVLAERVECVDYIFSGPALKSFPEFLRGLSTEGESPFTRPRGVLDGSGTPMTAQESTGEELSIDLLVPLQYDAFIERFERTFPKFDDPKPVLPFETSRGCWWGQRSHCTFCGLNGASMSYRAMSPEQAITQFASLFSYAGRVATLQSVDNILPKNYLTEVLPQLVVPDGMQMFYEVKADLTESELAVLARAGVKTIQPGIESLATSTLKLMKKGTTAYQNIRFLKSCTLLDVRPAWNLLVGFPGEPASVYMRYLEVLPLLTHLHPPSGVFPIRYDRFSPYYKRASDYGLDLKPMDFYSYVYPFGEEDLERLAYYFVDKNALAEYQEVMTQWLDKMRPLVHHWKSRWQTSSGGDKPKLHFQEGGRSIYDSRAGKVKIHKLTPAERVLLSELERPLTGEDLLKKFGAMDNEDICAALPSLEEKGLLFREGDRVVSLVLRCDPESYQAAEADPVATLSAVVTRPEFTIL